VAELLSFRYELPSAAERKQHTERYRRETLAKYVPSRRHTMQLDFEQYLSELERETEAGRRRARTRAARGPRLTRSASEGRT